MAGCSGNLGFTCRRTSVNPSQEVIVVSVVSGLAGVQAKLGSPELWQNFRQPVPAFRTPKDKVTAHSLT